MVVLMGAAQVVGVGSIAPFVSVLVNPESAQTNPGLSWAFEGLNFESTDSFLLFLGLVVIAAVIMANALLALTQWALIRFGTALQYRLSRRLLEAYLGQPYATFLNRNSADTAKNVLAEIESLTTGVVMPLLRMVAFSVAGIFLLATLFWVNALLTITVIAVLGGGYAIAYLSVRGTLGRAGARRLNANTARYKAVTEAFGGIKELKVLGRESALVGQFDGPARQFAGATCTHQLVTMLPTYILQVLAVGVVILIALFLMGSNGETIEDTAPLLAIYVLAAQRLVPFLMQIYLTASQIRFFGATVDTVYEDLVQASQTRPSELDAASNENRLPFRGELRLDQVSFAYSDTTKPAVQDVTLSIPFRSFVAFVGMTGAGKTTLVDIILGLLQPSGGTLSVDGTVLDGTVLRAWQNNLGYVPQDIYLADDSIAANIAFGIAPQDRKMQAIENAARIANIHDFVSDELPEGFDTLVGERGVRLSGGQRQRIGIARALYHDPEVLVLDEATSNLDQGTERAVHTAIEQAAKAKTVIMIAHRLSTTRHCDALYLFDKGRLVDSGDYETLLVSSDRFRAMSGTS
jgi:ABC-type bacteriocin/lantibiotic exporter with double-glycine peptidase domain